MPEQSRQLAAIMFTDIVGYTSLMGDDEDKAFVLLEKNRQLQKPLIENFEGCWIKELGDGVLASFSSAINAVNCAAAIIKSCEKCEDLQLRIGIHVGDVIFKNGDVFGDGVNIASRLQVLAPICGIWVSESVYKTVSNKKEIKTKFVREEILKNVKEPVRIYEVIIGNSQPEKVASIHDQKQTVIEKSIAVLPFVNMSNDPEQEYFSDGMAEEILNSLVHLKDLKVTSRTSSFQFKGKNVDHREIGEKLGVQTVLEGSVRKYGSRLRVTAQLINIEDGFHLWSEKYDSNMEDIFAIQEGIALAITQQLKVTLLDKEKSIIIRTPTESKEAYELYLKGRFFFNKRGEGLFKGLHYFQQAIEIDPEFALVYVAMGEAYSLLSFYCLMLPHEALPKARESATKAIQLNPSHAEAYLTLAFISTFYDWDWVETKKQFAKVFSINPNYPLAYNWYSMYLGWVEGKSSEAIQASAKGVELEPFLPPYYNVFACILFIGGKYDDATRACKTALELDSNYFLTYWILGVIQTQLKNYNEAIKYFTISVNLSQRHVWPLADLCYAYALTGQTKEAEEILNELLIRHKEKAILGFNLTIAAYELGKQDLALELFEKAINEKTSNIICCNVWPAAEKMRTDPRFFEIIKKINFPV